MQLSPLFLIKKKPRGRLFPGLGADGRTRTGDLLITNQLLYQLSHTSERDCSTHDIITYHFQKSKPFLRKKQVFYKNFNRAAGLREECLIFFVGCDILISMIDKRREAL